MIFSLRQVYEFTSGPYIPFSYNDYKTVYLFFNLPQVSVSVSKATVLAFLAKPSVQDYKLDPAFLHSWLQP